MHSNGEAVYPSNSDAKGSDSVHPYGIVQQSLKDTEEPGQLIHSSKKVVHLGVRQLKQVKVDIRNTASSYGSCIWQKMSVRVTV